MHTWDEKDFDWFALDKAGYLISKVLKAGRIGCNYKEKYGTLRLYSYFYNGSLHSLCYPGYHYNRFPKWLWHLDVWYIQRICSRIGLRWLIFQFQKPFYTFAYLLAMQKYEHIREEICVDAEYPNLIIGGKEIYNKHWEEL